MTPTEPKPADPVFQYSAFISYSRKDAPFALWLHRRLEGFRFPAYDGRKLTRNAKFPLSPAFRDLDELAASGDLGDSIRKSLEASGALVVLCSPAAAASPWVNKEVEHFLALGRHERILPVLLAGEPVFAGPGAPADAAFPAAMKDDPTEALWIDARGVESKERIFARIAAGLLAVSFDQVWKRQQRAKRALAMMTAAAAVIVGLPLLAFAWQASQPINMAECPLDKLVFADGWLKNSPDSQMLRVSRVGQTNWGYCGDSEPQAWTPAMAGNLDCRGPYGDTVFEGDYRPEGETTTIRDLYITWHAEPGAPCCYWNVHSKDSVQEIFEDEKFKWFASGSAPALASMPFNEISLDQYSTVEDDRFSGGKTLTASECRVDFIGRTRMSMSKVAGWFAPKPEEEPPP